MLHYDVITPDQIEIGELAYLEGDLPGRPEDFKQVVRIDLDDGEYLFYVEGEENPYHIEEGELLYRLPNPKLSDFQAAAQRKAARNSIAGLVANAPEVIEVYKNLLSALAGLDDPRRAVDLLDMVIAVGLPGAERYISSITSRCKNGHEETADLPAEASPQDIIEVLAELRSTCPECKQADPFFEKIVTGLEEKAEIEPKETARFWNIMGKIANRQEATEALNPSGLDPLAPEDEQ
jgi:hypothetical protein